MVFDMLNQPCLVYDLKEVASLDRANDVVLFRLRSEVLYVENERSRWEMALVDGDGDGTHVRIGRVTNKAIGELRMAAMGAAASDLDVVPLPFKKVEVLAKRMLWTDLVWNSGGVFVSGRHLALSKMSFRQRS